MKSKLFELVILCIIGVLMLPGVRVVTGIPNSITDAVAGTESPVLNAPCLPYHVVERIVGDDDYLSVKTSLVSPYFRELLQERNNCYVARMKRYWCPHRRGIEMEYPPNYHQFLVKQGIECQPDEIESAIGFFQEPLRSAVVTRLLPVLTSTPLQFELICQVARETNAVEVMNILMSDERCTADIQLNVLRSAVQNDNRAIFDAVLGHLDPKMAYGDDKTTALIKILSFLG